MHELCVIEGDGIGHEVIPAAVLVLQAVLPDLKVYNAAAGWDYFLERGVSVPDETLAMVRNCGAALFGAVSSPSHKVEGYRSAIITLRQSLDLYANIRPVQSLPGLSPRQGVDMIIVRENTEGLYAGRERMQGDSAAIAERVITASASYRIGLKALQLARLNGRRRVTIVHKANILPLTDGLFRKSVHAAAVDFLNQDDQITIDELLVDTAANQMLSQPQRFDVIVTTNLFGDILSDAAAYWCGGMGVAPSINLGDQFAIAEPVHGSAPDIAGKGIANPIAAILSAALLARYTWGLPDVASAIETAVRSVLLHDLDFSSGCAQPHLTDRVTRAVLNRLE